MRTWANKFLLITYDSKGKRYYRKPAFCLDKRFFTSFVALVMSSNQLMEFILQSRVSNKIGIVANQPKIRPYILEECVCQRKNCGLFLSCICRKRSKKGPNYLVLVFSFSIYRSFGVFSFFWVGHVLELHYSHYVLIKRANFFTGDRKILVRVGNT